MNAIPQRSWEVLFHHAMEIIDSAVPHAGGALDHWTFGGGTALMLEYQQRWSKDVDIFLPDPQCLGFLSPRLNSLAEELCGSHYDEQAIYLKLYFRRPEATGEIDFIVSQVLTAEPWRTREVLGRTVKVETASEILAKKLKYRGDALKARDMFDLACVLERNPEMAGVLKPFYAPHADTIRIRLKELDDVLRAEFESLEPLAFDRSYDECTALMMRCLA